MLAAIAAVVTLILIAAGGHRSASPSRLVTPSWKGLAGSQRPRVAVGQRVVVLLTAPSLADRLGNVGGLATDEQERRWTATALAAQKLLIAFDAALLHAGEFHEAAARLCFNFHVRGNFCQQIGNVNHGGLRSRVA